MGDVKVEDTQDWEGKAENPQAIPQEDLRHGSPPGSDPISQENLPYATTSNRVASSYHSPQAAAIPSVRDVKGSPTSTAIPDTFQAPALSTVEQLLTLSTQVGDPLTMAQERLESAIDDPTLDSAHSIVDSEPQRIQGFAKLEFTDGEFYMNTYSVELGRDIRAARVALEREIAHVQRNGAKRRKRSSSDGNTSEHAKWPNGRPMSSSVVSESGGVIALDHSDIETTKRKRRGRRRTKSTTSSSQQLSRKSSFTLPLIRTDYQSLAMESLMDSSLGHQYHDPQSSLPHPEACPLIPVHPPAAAGGARSSHKTISRKHIKIAFNFEKHCFEVRIMGRNGAFVDEHWYPEGDTRPLRSGSVIQIGGVLIRFVLPDLAIDGAVEDASGSVSESSLGLDVEDGQEQARSMDDSSGVNDVEEEGEEGSNGYKDGDEEDEEDSNDNGRDYDKFSKARAGHKPAGRANRPTRTRKPTRGKELSKATQRPKTRRTKTKKVQPSAKTDTQAEPLAPPPKRKGPGRPPKDGYMSQKERKRLRQQAEEAARALEQGDSVARPGGGKGKSIQSDGINQEDASRQPNGKRKYKRREKKAENQAEEREAARGSAEHGVSHPPEQNDARSTKPPKPMKPVKPPRSPSPEIDKASLTPEQLAKPQASYVVLIHDVLTNSETGQLSLRQIYRAIERNWPYFMFDQAATATKGWQSSVRHNLLQHDAFRKVQREGKGWMWGLVPGVPIDKERKRRGTPPSMLQHPGQPPAPHTMQHSFHPQIPPPSANMHYPFFGGHVNLHPSHRPYPPPPPSQFAPVPNGFLMQLPGMRPQSPSAYQSPYSSAPPKTSDPPKSFEEPQPHPSAPATGKEASENKAPETADFVQANSVDFLNKSSMSQLPHPQQHSTPEVNGTAEKHNPSRSQDLLRAVERFKSALISSLSDDAHAESRVTSAISRVLGMTPETGASRSAPEDEEEKAIRKELEKMIGKFEGRNGGQASDLPPPPSFQEQQQGRNEESQKAKPGLSQGERKGGGSEPTQLMKILEEVSRGEDGVVGLSPTSLGSTVGEDLVNGVVRDSGAAMTETKMGGRDGQRKGSGTKRRWKEEAGDESADAVEGAAAKKVRT